MYVRDHLRHEFFEAMGFDVDDYDRRVIRLTSEITEQVFPVGLPLHELAFWERLDRVAANTKALGEARAQGGVRGRLRAARLLASNVGLLARLYLMRPKRNVLPADVRLEPVW